MNNNSFYNRIQRLLKMVLGTLITHYEQFERLKKNAIWILTDKPVKAEMKLTNEEWSLELSERTSERYKNLAGQVRTAVCIPDHFHWLAFVTLLS